MRRNTSISGVVVEFPDYLCFSNDRNVVTAIGTDTHVETMALTVEIDGVAYSYSSPIKAAAINIGDLLRLAEYGTQQEIKITVNGGSGHSGQILDTLKMFDGRSLANRTHGSDSIICVDDTDEVEIFAPYPGMSINIGGTSHSLSLGVNTIDTDGEDRGVLHISTGVQKVGEYGKLQPVEGRVIRFVRKACPLDVTLRYVSTDGCRRVAFGRMLSKEYSAEATEYRGEVGQYRSLPARHIDNVGQVYRVGFANVEEGQHLEDLILSESVQWEHEDPVEEGTILQDVTPVTASQASIGEVSDYIVDIKLLG